MKILVTGGAGFIGSNFVKHLLNENPGYTVINLDKLTYSGNLENLRDIENNKHYEFVHGDICERTLVNELFGKYGFNTVINFAAETHVDRSLLDPSPFLETNVKGTQVLLEAARTHWETGTGNIRSGKKFIHISTDEVYGSLAANNKFTEESPLKPNNPYSASKAAADLLCTSYYKSYGVPVIITRSSNNYGPYQYPEKLIPVVIKNALAGEKIPVYGKGEHIRDWIFVEDNCRAIYTLLNKGVPGETYNISGNCEMRNRDMVFRVCELLTQRFNLKDAESLIDYIPDPRGDAHDYRYAMDSSRIEALTGWAPDVKLDEGLERTVEWYVSNREWLGV